MHAVAVVRMLRAGETLRGLARSQSVQHFEDSKIVRSRCQQLLRILLQVPLLPSCLCHRLQPEAGMLARASFVGAEPTLDARTLTPRAPERDPKATLNAEGGTK